MKLTLEDREPLQHHFDEEKTEKNHVRQCGRCVVDRVREKEQNKRAGKDKGRQLNTRSFKEIEYHVDERKMEKELCSAM